MRAMLKAHKCPLFPVYIFGDTVIALVATMSEAVGAARIYISLMPDDYVIEVDWRDEAFHVSPMKKGRQLEEVGA